MITHLFGQLGTEALNRRRLVRRSFGQRFSAVKRGCVPRGRDDERSHQRDDSNQSADIKQPVIAAGNSDEVGMHQSKRADGEKDPQLGGAEPPKGNSKNAYRMCCERDLDRQQIVGEQKTTANRHTDVAPEDQADEDEQDAQGVQHVIDVETIPWALVMTHARERSVQAVAEPVHGEECNRNQERGGRAVPIAQAGAKHGDAGEDRQVIGVDGRGQPLCHPDEASFLDRRQKAVVNALGFGVGRIRHLSKSAKMAREMAHRQLVNW
jgi:hypothetical protein